MKKREGPAFSSYPQVCKAKQKIVKTVKRLHKSSRTILGFMKNRCSATVFLSGMQTTKALEMDENDSIKNENVIYVAMTLFQLILQNLNIKLLMMWWKWNPWIMEKNIDFSRPFFEQFKELFHELPLRAQLIDAPTRDLSPYTNFAGWCKNCYFNFYSEGCEDTAYGFFLKRNKRCYDSSITWECENVFDVTNGFKSYNVFTGQGNVINCLDCYFIKDCRNCTNCFGSVNLRNKSYVFFNEQLTKEEYKKRINKIDLGSYKVYESTRKKVCEFWKSNIPRPIYDDFSKNVTGNYVFESKNCRECYDVGYSEDSKFLMLIKAGIVRNSYDYMDGWTAAERMYECVTAGSANL